MVTINIHSQCDAFYTERGICLNCLTPPYSRHCSVCHKAWPCKDAPSEDITKALKHLRELLGHDS